MNSKWKDLADEFRRIIDPFSSMRADWTQREDKEKEWRIAASQDSLMRKTFEALAKKGGIFLLKSPEATRLCSPEALSPSDDLARWLESAGELTKNMGASYYGEETNGEKRNIILLGSIDRILANSVLACLELEMEEEKLGTALSHIWEKYHIFLDDIDSFEKVRGASAGSINDLLQKGRIEISEDKIQEALEEILSVPVHKKDWGGEENDLYTSNVMVQGIRMPTAYLLKGPAVRSPYLQIADCGKNGDQIVRLFQSPAELFVVQYVGEISEAIIKDLESKVIAKRSTGALAWYCVINGQDTVRLLRAYGKL